MLDTRGSAPAVIDEHGEATFDELNAAVNRIIHAGRASGLEVGDTVAALCGNRRELVDVTLAAAHAGWVVVPVNWHWVADELHHVMTDSGAKALFVEAEYLPTAADALGRDGGDRCALRVVIGRDDASVVEVDGVAFEPLTTWVSSSPTDEPDGQCTGGPMFYTSGTTGFPKGVRGSLNRTGEDIVLWELVAGSFVGMFVLKRSGV
jgi:long-chain acyl-CoA synthetase